MYEWYVRPLMMITWSSMWILEPTGKVMNLEIESRNDILLVMNDGIKVDCMKRQHINP